MAEPRNSPYKQTTFCGLVDRTWLAAVPKELREEAGLTWHLMACLTDICNGAKPVYKTQVIPFLMSREENSPVIGHQDLGLVPPVGVDPEVLARTKVLAPDEDAQQATVSSSDQPQIYLSVASKREKLLNHFGLAFFATETGTLYVSELYDAGETLLNTILEQMNASLIVIPPQLLDLMERLKPDNAFGVKALKAAQFAYQPALNRVLSLNLTGLAATATQTERSSAL